MNIKQKAMLAAENMPKVYNSAYNKGLEKGIEQGKPLGKIELLQDSEYMNAKVSGTAIVVTDINSIEHNVKCNVASKNLLNPRDFVDTSVGGIVTVNEDGSVYLYSISGKDIETQITYTFDVTEKSVLSLSDDGSPDLSIFIDDQNTEEDHKVLDIGTHTLKLRLTESTSATVYIQLEKGTTPTLYTPYMTDFLGVEVSRYGKNLFRPQFDFIFADASYTDGILFTPQLGGNTIACATNPLYVPQNTWLYYKHALLLGKDRIVIRIYNSNGENISTTEKTDIICSSAWYLAAYKGYIVDKPASGFSFKVTSNVDYITLCYCGMDSEGGNEYGNLQLELGTTATPYEPYIEPTVHTANADGTVDGIKSISPNMTLLTNNNGVVINANYLRDIDTYIDNLKTNVALTGGE